MEWIINTHSLRNGHLLRLRVRPELISPIRIVPADGREKRHHEGVLRLRLGQVKKWKIRADQRVAKKISVTADSKQDLLTIGSESRADGLEAMDADVEVAPAR
jgi:hypothetical protein